MSDSSRENQEDQEATSSLCPIILSFLPSLALGDLRPSLERAVRSHLASCENCASELARYEAVTRWLQVQLSGEKRHSKRGAPSHSLERLLIGSDADHTTSTALIEALLVASSSGDGDTVDYARLRSHAFRIAFGGALMGRKDLVLSPAPIRHTPLAADSPITASQRRESNFSEAFAAGVQRSLEAIARFWPASENQSPNGGQEPC